MTKLLILTLLTIALSFEACCKKTNPDKGKQNTSVAAGTTKREDIKDDFQSATVINMTALDGCQYLLKLESGEKLNPINLPDSLRQDNIKIRVKYIPSDLPTICMSGKTVKITAVEKD